ncbi:gamma-glutamylcyclotransferase (GGCT)/AIG2-like uncharacterized protein YtfP [Paenibacillus sp. OAS669]|nr:gamma-glutamylcyclotransferase (GGCT)/AIG2-like uncharacterized protein YtfP [Paenibacillus sp. OAS669]
MIWIFVYGTLLQGETNHEVAKPYVEQLEKGCVRGALYNYGPYPGLVLAGEGSVEGEWLLVSEEGLVQLDGLEDYHGPGQLNERECGFTMRCGRNAKDGCMFGMTAGGVHRFRTVHGAPAVRKHNGLHSSGMQAAAPVIRFGFADDFGHSNDDALGFIFSMDFY